MMTNAFKNSRSGYTLGCPRPRFAGGIGSRSTSLTKMTSNESWDTIGLSPLLVVCDYRNERSKSPAWLLIYDQASTNSYTPIFLCLRGYSYISGAAKLCEKD